jgi:hypothetical protein
MYIFLLMIIRGLMYGIVSSARIPGILVAEGLHLATVSPTIATHRIDVFTVRAQEVSRS